MILTAVSIRQQTASVDPTVAGLRERTGDLPVRFGSTFRNLIQRLTLPS
jgi:hypothetical protein